MGFIVEKIATWIVKLIFGLDALFGKLCKTELDPQLHRVVIYSLIISVILAITSVVCLMCKVEQSIIQTVLICGGVLMLVCVIVLLFSNIKLIESIFLKIVYVLLNLIAAGVIGVIVWYALQTVITLLVLYLFLHFVFGFFKGAAFSNNDGTDHAGRKHVATLENGVKIYKGYDLLHNDYYKGSDGYEYEPCSGNRFTRK